jgi:ABC-2 type transport system permease protein
MGYLKSVSHVAFWEFWRYFKLKDIIITFVFFVVSGVVGFFAALFMESDSKTKVELAVINNSEIVLDQKQVGSLSLEYFDSTFEEELRARVGESELDGLLIVNSSEDAKLLIYKLPNWKGNVVSMLTEARLDKNLAEIGMERQLYDDLSDRFKIETEYHEKSERKFGKVEIFISVIFIGMMLMGVLMGNAILYQGITGEKSVKIVEQVVAVISPQIWIDGKILGISLVVIAYGICFSMLGFFGVLVAGSFGLFNLISFEAIRLSVILQFFILAALGYFFWFAFFGAISATINDPNTSSKGSFMMMPFLPFFFVIGAFKDPDLLIMKILGIFPVTSPSIFPVRLILGEVEWWEFPSAVILMFGAIWLMRKIAGKIFTIGIMIQGKEPSFAEIAKWFKTK